MNVKVNTVDLCYNNRKYKYEVADVESFGWEMIGVGLLYPVIKNETPYSLTDCKSEVYVKFRDPKENENQDSMISIVKVTALTPHGELIIRTKEYDAESLSYAMPKGVLWGKKAESGYSQGL